MTVNDGQVLAVLRDYISEITSRSMLAAATRWSKVEISRLGPGDGRHLLTELQKGIQLYVKSPMQRRECLDRLALLLEDAAEAPASSRGPKKIVIREESDIVSARGAARALSGELGFTPATQIKIATAVSELARNIVQYAGSGEITLIPFHNGRREGIEITSSDQGPGISDTAEIFEGRNRSRTGLGIGLRGTRNLMDEFDLKTAPGQGVEVRIRKYVQ